MCPAATKKFEVSVESDQHPGPAVLVSGRLAKLTVVVTRQWAASHSPVSLRGRQDVQQGYKCSAVRCSSPLVLWPGATVLFCEGSATVVPLVSRQWLAAAA